MAHLGKSSSMRGQHLLCIILSQHLRGSAMQPVSTTGP